MTNDKQTTGNLSQGTLRLTKSPWEKTAHTRDDFMRDLKKASAKLEPKK